MISQDTIFLIEGPLREPLIIMEWLVIFLAFELALIFLIKVKTHKEKLKSLQERAYIWLFFGYGMMWVFIYIADYYIGVSYYRRLVLNLGFLWQILGLFVFIYILEKYKIFLKKHLFTKSYIIITILYLFVFFINIELASYISSIFWITFLIFFIIYLKELSTHPYISKASKNIKFDTLKLFLGIILVAMGYQLTTRIMIIVFGLNSRLIGNILQIIGLIMLSFYFASIPSFSEYDWKDKVESIYITDKSGIFLYKKTFRANVSTIGEQIIAGYMTSIRMMLQELINKPGASIIEKEGKVVIIQSGTLINGVIICDEKLNSLQILLNNFIIKIEEIYQGILQQWDGNLEIFKPIDNIIQDFFS